MLQILGLLGGIVGAIALCWRLLDEFKAYLHIELTSEDISGRYVKLRTTVENRNSFPRRLDGAFLLVGPADENPDETASAVFKYENESFDLISSLNEMVRVVTNRMKDNPSTMRDDAGRMIIPLTYYYIENYDVADEKLSYEHIISYDKLPPRIYAARFCIETISRLHRVVQAAFEVTAETH